MTARFALAVAMAVAALPAMGGSAASGRGIFDPIPTEVPNPDASPGYVHLSSRSTEAAAEAIAADLTQSWGTWFEGHRALIRRVDQGKNGVHFQVLLKTHTQGDAWRICMNIKGAGGDCYAGGL